MLCLLLTQQLQGLRNDSSPQQHTVMLDLRNCPSYACSSAKLPSAFGDRFALSSLSSLPFPSLPSLSLFSSLPSLFLSFSLSLSLVFYPAGSLSLYIFLGLTRQPRAGRGCKEEATCRESSWNLQKLCAPFTILSLAPTN